MSKDWGKVFIATRYQPQLPAWSCESLIGLVQFGMRPGDQRDFVYSKTMHKAANMLVRKALASGCDSICFIDSDGVFGSGALEELRSDPEGWDYDVLQAFTVKRGWPPQPMFLVEQPEQPHYAPHAARGRFYQTQLPINPDYIYPGPGDNYRISVSLHFTLIRLEVFRQIMGDKSPEEMFWFEYIQDNGEDVNFSIKANAAGFKLGMTTRLKVGHVSEVIMGWDTMVDFYSYKYLLESGQVTSGLEQYHAHHVAILSLAELIAEYTGDDPQQAYQRVLMGSGPVADNWYTSQPRTAAEVERWYGQAHAYLYDLVLWNTSPSFQLLLRELQGSVLAGFTPGARALEFGGGIGTLAEFMSTQGLQVHYYDLPGVLRDFAAWRFARLPEGLRPALVERWPTRYYDLVTAIDVVEHLHPDRAETVLRGLFDAVAPGGYLFAHNNWSQQDGAYPQHFDHAALWERLLAEYGMYQSAEHVWQCPVDTHWVREEIDLAQLTGAIQEVAA